MAPFRFLIRLLAIYLCVFIVAKLAFMVHCAPAPYSAADVCQVVYHGFPLDLSTAGYFMALPLLLALTAVWWPSGRRFQSLTFGIYAFLISVILTLILVIDCALYTFWGFKLDATALGYADSPSGALQSVSTGFIVAIVAILILVAATLIYVQHVVQHWWCRTLATLTGRTLRYRASSTIGLLLVGGLLFLAIRGGVGRSTMNIGRVYFSDNQFFNHAAVNPVFNLISSSFKNQRYDRLYRFFDDEQLTEQTERLQFSTDTQMTDTLLTTTRPNVLLVIMEGFGASFIEALGGEADVAPEFSKLAIDEGVLFTHCYANSFRTDRGTVSTLSGYPAFPNLSVMKLPRLSRSLPSVARTLSDQGYATDFYYGGDVNFTNMKSYLLSTGFHSAVGDTEFPLEARRTHAWGVTDEIAFDSLYHRLMRRPTEERWFTTFLTLASHEPWEVPYHRIEGNERANSMAYLDHCFGQFIARLKASELWQNLLVVCIADHAIPYPEGLTEADPLRYHIPMLWLGGAVRQARVYPQICNQSDLAATLLGQLALPHDDFRFSRDVTSTTYTYPCAFHTFAGGVAFIDSTGYTVHDLTADSPISESPVPSLQRTNAAKAYLQITINDLAERERMP